MTGSCHSLRRHHTLTALTPAPVAPSGQHLSGFDLLSVLMQAHMVSSLQQADQKHNHATHSSTASVRIIFL